MSIEQFEKRKHEHLNLALEQANEAIGYSGLDQIRLIHEAIPDLNFSDIDISSYRFGQRTASPFIISSMTAGNPQGVNINQSLIEACQATGWAMGVGSQRRQLSDQNAANEWFELRKLAPTVQLFGNLGIAQLIETSIAEVENLVESLEAQAMIIHCNPLQECIQPEGTPNFKGSWEAISELAASLSVPVIVKETGCGFSLSSLNRLMATGVAAVDISGFGGTHWGRIEGRRAEHDGLRSQAAISFKNWGINTVDTLENAVSLTPDYEIWGSGGVRNGLDAAKLLALGASTVGFAKPMLQAALEDADEVIKLMKLIEYELKVALFCTGSATIEALQENHNAIK